MMRTSRTIALAVPAVLWGCTGDPVTSVAPSPEPRLRAASADAGVPLVYDVENTGAHIPAPSFPPFAQLPSTPILPDPFRPITGGPVDLSLGSWENRRNEFKASIERFEIGPKPDRSDVDVTASFVDKPAPAVDSLYVVVTRRSNGRSLTLRSPISLPDGPGPFPAIIGMNSLSGGLPGDIFTSRNVARINYRHNDVTTYFGKSPSNPYYQLYPEHAGTASGQYSAWSWGVSRLVDGLQMVASQPNSPLPIDTRRLGVTGCSYAGKMALFSGAFDERIALTIAQESGGGGAPAWRVSHGIEPDGSVEKTNNTDGNWFLQSMKSQFRSDSVYKLPHDHHSLMAMVAPRALLVTGNTDFVWLSNRATYVTSRAVKEVYNTLGVGDRFGYYIDGQHGHCVIPPSQRPAIEAYVDRFLLGQAANTDVQIYPNIPAYTALDHDAWMPWANRATPDVRVEMDVQPAQISLASTAVVNVVLYSSATFDATAVNAATVRLNVHGLADVAPIMRGAAANTSVVDVNGDGRADRIIGFSTSALKAAGYARGGSGIWLRPATAPRAWHAIDSAPPTIVP